MLNRIMILLTKQKPNGATLEVITAANSYTVIYNGAPFNLRQLPDGYGTPRYRRTSYPNEGHAAKQATYLNDFFGTDAFTVVETL